MSYGDIANKSLSAVFSHGHVVCHSCTSLGPFYGYYCRWAFSWKHSEGWGFNRWSFHFTMFFSLDKNFTPHCLSTQGTGGSKPYYGLTSHPGGVVILLVTLCWVFCNALASHPGGSSDTPSHFMMD